MAEWTYDAATGHVTRDEGRRLVAGAVSEEDGPLIAEAPEMEALLREYYQKHANLCGNPPDGFVTPCFCTPCKKYRAILRRIDETRKPS